MPLTIDYARVSDTPTLETLFRAVVAPLALYSQAARAEQLARYTAEEFARLVAADAHSVILARIDGVAAGFAIIEQQHGPVWLEWYGVATERRGQGVGEALLRFVVAEATATGATRVWCDTRTDNLASNALLARLGFRQLCRLPDHWHGQDYFLWDLSPL